MLDLEPVLLAGRSGYSKRHLINLGNLGVNGLTRAGEGSAGEPELDVTLLSLLDT